MRAAVLRGFDTPLEIEERPVPVPSGDQVVVDVRAAGVCHSDLHVIAGSFGGTPLPLILGHEIAGEVDGLGNVLVYGAWGCGSCPACARGEEQLCPRCVSPGFEADGGYAEQVLVRNRSCLVPLQGLDPVQAAPLADAGLTAYRAVGRILRWLDDDARVVVIGAGGLGQFAIQFLTLLSGARVSVVDTSGSKRERARALGADEALAPGEFSGPARAILDFVGTDETLALASRSVEPGGIVMLVGEAGGRLSFGMRTFPWEAHLATTISGTRADLDAVVELAREERITWDVETVPLENANDALDRLRRGEVCGRLVLIP